MKSISLYASFFLLLISIISCSNDSLKVGEINVDSIASANNLSTEEKKFIGTWDFDHIKAKDSVSPKELNQFLAGDMKIMETDMKGQSNVYHPNGSFEILGSKMDLPEIKSRFVVFQYEGRNMVKVVDSTGATVGGATYYEFTGNDTLIEETEYAYFYWVRKTDKEK